MSAAAGAWEARVDDRDAPLILDEEPVRRRLLDPVDPLRGVLVQHASPLPGRGAGHPSRPEAKASDVRLQSDRPARSPSCAAGGYAAGMQMLPYWVTGSRRPGRGRHRHRRRRVDVDSHTAVAVVYVLGDRRLRRRASPGEHMTSDPRD
jgi:hypothetical protein